MNAIIEMPAHVLKEALTRVKHAAGKEPSRPIFCTIVVDAEGDVATFIAADNYRIAVNRVEFVEVKGEWTRALIPVDSLPLILALLRQTKKLPVELERIAVNRLRLSTHVGSVEILLMDGTYPDISIVTGPAQDFPALVAFNPAYMGDLKAGGAGSSVATVHMKDWRSPVVVRIGDDYTEYVMPVKTPDFSDVPVEPAA